MQSIAAVTRRIPEKNWWKHLEGLDPLHPGKVAFFEYNHGGLE